MGAASGWWTTFFEGPAVDFWLRATTNLPTKDEAAFLADALGLTPGARVLDVPCGGGRHALELAAQGCRVTGVDISADFLDAARALAAERALAIDWEERDMR